MKFETNFERVIEEIEDLNRHWKMKGTPSGHERIWQIKKHVKLWIAGRETAELLRFLVVNNEARTILDLGTSIGYATLFLAHGAMVTNGKVHTIEAFEPKIELAQKLFKDAKLSEYIHQIHGDITEVLTNWNESVDLVFMDADKRKNLEYLKLVLPHLRNDGVIVVDDVNTMENYMKDFLDYVETDKTLSTFHLNIDRGLLLITKKDLSLWSKFAK